MTDQKKTADGLKSAVKALAKVQGVARKLGAEVRENKGASPTVRR